MKLFNQVVKQLACAAAAACAFHDASAGIIFSPGAIPSADVVDNVRFHLPGTANGPSNTVTGITGGSGYLVDFTSSDVLVTVDDADPAPPPPLVRATDGELHDLLVGVRDGVFTTFFYNIRLPYMANPPTRVAQISVLGYDGELATFTQTLGNGNNIMQIMATDDTLLRSVSITSLGPVTDVRQVRVGGMGEEPQRVPVSEPATLWILGLGALAFAKVRRTKPA